MSKATDRFAELRRIFRAAIPSRHVGAARKRQIALAASLALAIENTTTEIRLGIRSEESPELELMHRLADEALKAAHITITIEEAMRTNHVE